MGIHTDTTEPMNDEWYTPPEYVEAARTVLGHFDIDVASNDIAQQTIKASRYYTIEDSSLELDAYWFGTVWMNPPYSRVIQQFCDKLVREYSFGHTKAAIVLTNNGTDTSWWHSIANIASALCFTKGQMNVHPENAVSTTS